MISFKPLPGKGALSGCWEATSFWAFDCKRLQQLGSGYCLLLSGKQRRHQGCTIQVKGGDVSYIGKGSCVCNASGTFWT